MQRNALMCIFAFAEEENGRALLDMLDQDIMITMVKVSQFVRPPYLSLSDADAAWTNATLGLYYFEIAWTVSGVTLT